MMMNTQNNQGANAMDLQIIGAIKIKDGLFIGDQFAAQDLEFIITNKVTHIINCAGKQIANIWESIGVDYLTFPWLENDSQILFDQKDEVLNEIYNFAEKARRNGESVLVHSVRGQSRSCCVIAAYFMKRYGWTLIKTLEYLNSRRPDLEIRASFFHQLTALESRLIRQGVGGKSNTWNEFTDDPALESEERLITNTFLNAKNAPFVDFIAQVGGGEKIASKITWVDNGTNDKGKLQTLVIPFEASFTLKKNNKIKQTAPSAVSNPKSILRGSALRAGGMATKNAEDVRGNSHQQSGRESRQRPSSSKPIPSSTNNQGNSSAIRSNSLSKMENDEKQGPSSTFGNQYSGTSNIPVNNYMNTYGNGDFGLNTKVSESAANEYNGKQPGTAKKLQATPLENSDKKEQYYRNVKSEEEVGSLAVENGGNTLNYMASKQLREALERKNAILKNSGMKENMVVASASKTPNNDLDSLKKYPQKSEMKRDPGSASPNVQRGESPNPMSRGNMQLNKDNRTNGVTSTTVGPNISSTNNSFSNSTNLDSVYSKTLKRYGLTGTVKQDAPVNANNNASTTTTSSNNNTLYNSFLMGGEVKVPTTITSLNPASKLIVKPATTPSTSTGQPNSNPATNINSSSAQSQNTDPRTALSNKMFPYQNNSPYLHSFKKGPVRAYEMPDRPRSAQQNMISNTIGASALKPSNTNINLAANPHNSGPSIMGNVNDIENTNPQSGKRPDLQSRTMASSSRPQTAPGFRSFSPGIKSKEEVGTAVSSASKPQLKTPNSATPNSLNREMQRSDGMRQRGRSNSPSLMKSNYNTAYFNNNNTNRPKWKM